MTLCPDDGTATVHGMGEQQGREDVAQFMAVVMNRLGVENGSQLARLAVDRRWIDYTQTRSVSRWVAGTTAPSHEMTMLLLREAGLLRDELAVRGEAARTGDEAAPPGTHAAELAEAALLLREVRLLLPQLHAIVQARRAATESHPPEKAAN